MGNRAVIMDKNKNIGVYLHWSGDRDSVEAFLKYCELKGYRSFEDLYGKTRFCQVVGNFFGGNASLGIDLVSKLDCDNYDNGVYIVNGWEIVGREYNSGDEQQDSDLLSMLQLINSRQPREEQLSDVIIGFAVDNVKSATAPEGRSITEDEG